MHKVQQQLILFAIGMIFLKIDVMSQSIAINTTNQPPHPSAILDVSSDSMKKNEMESPPEGLMVYQIDGHKGIYFSRDNRWVKFAQQEYQHVPIGGILDWMPLGQQIPIGFKICDGSSITDPESPYYNASVPNLEGKFIKSVLMDNMDSTGGNSTHNHSVFFPPHGTSNANIIHQHTAAQVNIPTNSVGHTHFLNNPSITPSTHNHEWARLTSNENWRSFDSNGDAIELVNWTDGMDAAGSGNYPIAVYSVGGLDQTKEFYTSNSTHTHSGGSPIDLYTENHSHTLIVPGVGENANQVHNHNIRLGTRISTPDSHLPLSIKLVKIMRIK
jgi:hypothetical protein